MMKTRFETFLTALWFDLVGLSNYWTLLSLGIGSNSWMWDALYSGFENFEQA